MTQQGLASTVRTPESSPSYLGWRVLLGAVVGLALSPGPVALLLLGALAPRLAAAHGWSLGAIMASLTVLNLASIVAAPIAGKLIDRVGARAVMLPSIAAMAGCLLLFGYAADTLPRLYAISALYGFATIGAQSPTYMKLLTGWFDRNRGLVLGIGSAGIGLGYSVLPVVIAFGFARLGPAGTTALLAGLLIALPLLLNVFVAFPREAAADPARDAPGLLAGATLRAAMSAAPFWIMAAAIVLIAVIATGIVPHFASIARDMGLQPVEAAGVASLFGLATLGGRLLAGWLFDRFFAPRVACLMFLLAGMGYAVAWASIAFGLGWEALASGAALMGLGFGAPQQLPIGTVPAGPGRL